MHSNTVAVKRETVHPVMCHPFACSILARSKAAGEGGSEHRALCRDGLEGGGGAQ